MTSLQDTFAALEVLPNDAELPAPEDFTGRFTTAAAVLRYMLAGNATVTFKGRTTRFTYKVAKPKDDRGGDFLFVSVLNGPDNYLNYAYLGYIRRGVYFHGGHKAKVGATAQSAKAFDWVYRRLAAGQLPPELEIWHEGKCGRCGRKLTVPESVADGFGPECINHIHPR